MSPFGFLIVERLLVRMLGDSRYVVRFVPLVCGIGSLWLFKSLALRWLSSRSALVALALFVLSDDLVYYASELKPYSSDLLVGLCALVASARLARHPGDPRSTAIVGLLALAAPWFSFSALFVIAGCGAAWCWSEQ